MLSELKRARIQTKMRQHFKGRFIYVWFHIDAVSGSTYTALNK
jgi:hypothetical protein